MKKFCLPWTRKHWTSQRNFGLQFLPAVTILQGRNVFFVSIGEFFKLFFVSPSFVSDCHMVLDAVVLLTVHRTDTPATTTEETLWPERHRVTLPLNALNNYFQNCEIAFNHHTKLDTDRYNAYFLNKCSLQ